MPTNDIPFKKKCPICGKEKAIASAFYKSASPLYGSDKCVPICMRCIKKEVLNKDGTINKENFKKMLQRIDKPLYWDDLDSAYAQYRVKKNYPSDKDLTHYGDQILGLYFRNTMLKQNRDKNFLDSEKEGFMHSQNMTNKEKQELAEKFFGNESSKSKIAPSTIRRINETIKRNSAEFEPLKYSDKWMGNYTESDIKKLDHYYDSLESDYNIVTENHRDYARKIAKASLQMDKTFDDMMNGIDGADKRYENATKAFDTLSKSAKFSESTRSVNDVGASSFSKVAAMVEAHNWIPEHKPLKKDVIDEMIDYLSTITKSV